MVVRLDCGGITDWESFHTVFAEVFGFPGFFVRNMNAWIDCMGDVDTPETGMTTLSVPPGGVLTLQLDGVDELAVRCPEQYAALVECAAFVNWRRSSQGAPAVLALSYYKQAQPGTAANGGGRLGFWDFKLAVAPPAAELGRSAARIRKVERCLGRETRPNPA